MTISIQLPCDGVFVIIFFKTIYNKTIIRFGFSDILNNWGLGKYHHPWPSTSTLIIPDITKTSSNNNVYHHVDYSHFSCNIIVPCNFQIICNVKYTFFTSFLFQGIYEFLAFYLPCTKETLLKRAKNLLLNDQVS